MNDKVNELVFTEDCFKDDLWYEIGCQISLLLKAGYEVAIRQEETGIVAIDYDYDRDLGFGNNHIQWIDDEEWYDIIASRKEKESAEENMERVIETID